MILKFFVSLLLLIYCCLTAMAILARQKELPPPLTPLMQDKIHDSVNDAINVLQDPSAAMKNFPKDRRGEVDWVKTLRSGLITPRKNLLGDDPMDKNPMQELDLDILMKNTREMPWVKFPHLAHTQWLACSNCHPSIFVAKIDANPIDMIKILRGEFCGRCHDKVAFSLYICERCHSVPHSGSGPAWW